MFYSQKGEVINALDWWRNKKGFKRKGLQKQVEIKLLKPINEHGDWKSHKFDSIGNQTDINKALTFRAVIVSNSWASGHYLFEVRRGGESDSGKGWVEPVAYDWWFFEHFSCIEEHEQSHSSNWVSNDEPFGTIKSWE